MDISDEDKQEAPQEGTTLEFESADIRNIELSTDIETLVKKIRDTVKFFRKSPVKNDQLQDAIKSDPDIGKKLQLILDVRTR